MRGAAVRIHADYPHGREDPPQDRPVRAQHGDRDAAIRKRELHLVAPSDRPDTPAAGLDAVDRDGLRVALVPAARLMEIAVELGDAQPGG
jgi:hypothetical protein